MVPFSCTLPGRGKGFFSCAFSKYLAEHFGKVLFVSPEEADSPTFDIKLDYYQVPDDPDKFLTCSHQDKHLIEQVIREVKPKFVVIDSLTVCKIDDTDMQRLRAMFPLTSFIAIVQTDKQGRIRGYQELKHNCDAVICFPGDGIAQIEKIRFGGNDSGFSGFRIFEKDRSGEK